MQIVDHYNCYECREIIAMRMPHEFILEVRPTMRRWNAQIHRYYVHKCCLPKWRFRMERP